MVSSGNMEELSGVRDDLSLMPLRPLLLLLGWDRSPDIGNGSQVLEVLWPHAQAEVLIVYC